MIRRRLRAAGVASSPDPDQPAPGLPCAILKDGRLCIQFGRKAQRERARLSPDWKIELFDLEVELAFRACCFSGYLNGHYLLPIDTRASFCSQSI
jgi:hypothetical protein